MNSASLLMASSQKLSASLARLSSGSKIVNPSDDAGGLAVSLRLNSQISDTQAASNNVNNAVSFNQVQDGYLQKVGDALNRMSELALAAQDVTKTASDRSLYDKEYQSLKTYINDVSTKSFNGVSLFANTDLKVTTDAVGTTFSNVGVNLTSSNTTYASALADNILTIGNSSSGAVKALSDVTNAITELASQRATVGANEETLGYYAAHLDLLNTNLSAAVSRISDVDVATESTQYAKYNILVQSGTAMLAQANSMPQSVLKLLQ